LTFGPPAVRGDDDTVVAIDAGTVAGRNVGDRQVPTYEAGATVERRYPGPTGEDATRAAEPQIQAILAAGWLISGERWQEDAAGGAPIGDAIATGPASHLAGSDGELVVTFVAARDTDLPAPLPASMPSDPRADNPATIATVRLVVFAVVGILFLLFALRYAGQMGRMVPFAGGAPGGPVHGAPGATLAIGSPAP
jgi:hypothetical protein